MSEQTIELMKCLIALEVAKECAGSVDEPKIAERTNAMTETFEKAYKNVRLEPSDLIKS